MEPGDLLEVLNTMSFSSVMRELIHGVVMFPDVVAANPVCSIRTIIVLFLCSVFSSRLFLYCLDMYSLFLFL